MRFLGVVIFLLLLLGDVLFSDSSPAQQPAATTPFVNRLADSGEFVLRAYDGLTGFSPGAEFHSAVRELESGAVMRVQFLERMCQTPAWRERALPLVAALRNRLGRDPTLGEFRVALMQSPPAKVEATHRDEVSTAFLWLLLRPPSKEEGDTLAARLDAGVPLGEILAEITAKSGYAATYDNLVVRPVAYSLAFRNPLGGLRIENNPVPVSQDAFSSLARTYIGWNVLENNQADTVEKIRAATDQLFASLPARNMKAIPRVYLYWPSPVASYWPADLTPGDYTSTAFRTRLVRLIGRLGQAWNRDPRIAFIEMGFIGYWGEHHDPWFASSGYSPSLPTDMEALIGDAFRDAFPDKLVMNRYTRNFLSYKFGIHWDVFGAPGTGWTNGTTGITAELENSTHINRWQIAPRGGEIAPDFMGEPDWSLQSRQNVLRKNTPYLVDIIRRLHWNHVNALPYVDKTDSEIWDKASQLQNALGYRFVIDEASYSPVADPGGSLTLRLKIRNTGSSAFYYPWPLEVALLKPDTREVIWKALWDGLDLRTWLPDRSIDILKSFALPVSVPFGDAILSVTILDPEGGMVPAARFAVTNYYKGGRTPLGYVSIGGSPNATLLGGFDDLQSDNTLYYQPARVNPTTVLVQTNPPGLKLVVDGSEVVAPKEYSWANGTQHTLNAATPQQTSDGKFVFLGWSDGSTQASRTLTLASTTATYTAAFTTRYSLTTAVTGRGSLTLSPASGDGFYDRGTTVNLTAVPAIGCTLAGWGGDATGTALTLGVVMSATRSVTANFRCDAPVGYQYIPIPPCRVVDTRNPDGPFGGPRIGMGQTRTFKIPQGSCGIPTVAGAYSLNVTVVPAGTLGYLAIWPTGQNQPTVSTLNSYDGRIKANAAIVPAGTDGGVNVYAEGGNTDVVLDINGYFQAGNANALVFYPVTPCRLVDTRSANGPLGGPYLGAGQTRTLAIRGKCNLPSTALAYSLNFTVVPMTALGYLTTWPSGQPQPFVSTLNAPQGGTPVANAALLPAGNAGEIKVFVTDNTHLVLDVNGYFGPPGTGGYSLYPITPCRVEDTRAATGSLGGPVMAGGSARTFQVPESPCGIPASAAAYALNLTVVPQEALGFLTLWPAGSTQPLVSTLNAMDASITSNAALVPAGTQGGVSVYVLNTTHVLMDINAYFAP